MRFFLLNLLLALGLFCLNALLGAIQYRHRGICLHTENFPSIPSRSSSFPEISFKRPSIPPFIPPFCAPFSSVPAGTPSAALSG